VYFRARVSRFISHNVHDVHELFMFKNLRPMHNVHNLHNVHASQNPDKLCASSLNTVGKPSVSGPNS
jgi:hypothetical protein